MKGRSKILILVPSHHSIGGVSHYYQTLRPYFPQNIKYFIRGVRNQNSSGSRMIYPLHFILDIIRFFVKLSGRSISLIHVNTSFGLTGIFRDSIFILISKLYRKKTIVFFRGIDDTIIDRLTNTRLLWGLFKMSFLVANELWVLSGQVSDKLRSWGYKGIIRTETTLVDNIILKDFKIEDLIDRFNNKESFNILFVSRLERNKGIYETIDSFRKFREKYPDATLSICGEGKEKDDILTFIRDDLNKSIFYYGFVKEKDKAAVFRRAHLFLLPSYREGMPNVVLEAMAFGLPVLTTPVGGIADFFEEGKMGFLLKQTDPEKIAELIETTLKDSDLCKNIAAYNYEYAKKRFYAPVVAERIKSYYNNLILSDD